MEFRVYHDLDGKVRVAKIAPSGVEQIICSDVPRGYVSTIKVESYISYSYSQTRTDIDESAHHKAEQWCNQCHAKHNCTYQAEFINNKEETQCPMYA